MDSERILGLVLATNQDGGLTYPPEWNDVARAAVLEGLVRETVTGRLEMTEVGKTWLAARTPAPSAYAATMTKITSSARLKLKELAAKQGRPMSDVLEELIANA